MTPAQIAEAQTLLGQRSRWKEMLAEAKKGRLWIGSEVRNAYTCCGYTVYGRVSEEMATQWAREKLAQVEAKLVALGVTP